MLTTRVIPTEGRADGRRHRRRRPPRARPSRSSASCRRRTRSTASLDVAENLYFHGRYFGMSARESHERTDRLLEQFRLADRANANVNELSGGMAQRLMVARAIMHDPDVLVPRRADLGPRSAEPARAVGRHRRAAPARPDDRAHDALHGRGRPALRAGRDHRPRSAARARHARRAEEVDRRRHRGPPPRRRAISTRSRASSQQVPASTRRASSTARSTRTSSADGATLPEIITHADHKGFAVHDVGVDGNDARDRLHRSHRKGTP